MSIHSDDSRPPAPELTYTVAPSGRPGDAGSAPGSRSLAPALILLHGRGADENDLLALAPAFDRRFITIGIRAPYRFPFGGYTWFDMNDLASPDIGQVLSSLTALADCIRDLPGGHPIDPAPLLGVHPCAAASSLPLYRVQAQN